MDKKVEIDENIQDDIDKPFEVVIAKEKPTPEPNFDYDDYTPSDQEILEIETEIAEKIKKETKNG